MIAFAGNKLNMINDQVQTKGNGFVISDQKKIPKGCCETVVYAIVLCQIGTLHGASTDG